MWQFLYRWLLEPRALDEDARRQELILNILLLSIICLTAFVSLVTGIQMLVMGSAYAGMPPLALFGVSSFMAGLLAISRYGRYELVSYVFIGILLLVVTWPVVRWGVRLPHIILTYGLIVVMTGALISSRTAFYVAVFIFAMLQLLFYFETNGVIQFDESWVHRPAQSIDVVIYGILFLIIALVAWLSNREIDHSLKRARRSERELLEERVSLERKVRERTRALEKAHVEKVLDLQRFAEFGRLSSTLLHELANPLTSVSLDLQQLEDKGRSKQLGRIREGIEHMEQYVEAARRQLRNQSEIRVFDLATEIERVAGFLEAKARAQHVTLDLNLEKDLELKGDSIRFDHIVSNLVTNAIDAYDEMTEVPHKVVKVTMRHRGQWAEMIVQDHGRGISADQLPHLFEPFYTTKGPVRGTGIGLTITKQAVEEVFQGTIAASNSKKDGTKFVVKLPLT